MPFAVRGSCLRTKGEAAPFARLARWSAHTHTHWPLTCRAAVDETHPWPRAGFVDCASLSSHKWTIGMLRAASLTLSAVCFHSPTAQQPLVLAASLVRLSESYAHRISHIVLLAAVATLYSSVATALHCHLCAV